MKQLFDELAYKVSKVVTEKYSTSFSLGILALKPAVRHAVYAIYGYVRLADEIVDSFHDFDKARLLSRLSAETWHALEEGISLNPILQSFQETVNRFAIDPALIRQFLHSMEMDLHQVDYTDERYKEYILGSAEVVGLMCLQVFAHGNKEVYESLKPYAMKLGSAFQKINFLRDLNEDFRILGRSYFPDIDLKTFDNPTKIQIEMEIEAEFKEALIGIKRLPASSKFGVYLAYRYYLTLFRKIKNSSAEHIMLQRVRIPNSQKLSVAMRSYLQYKMALL